MCAIHSTFWVAACTECASSTGNPDSPPPPPQENHLTDMITFWGPFQDSQPLLDRLSKEIWIPDKAWIWVTFSNLASIFQSSIIPINVIHLIWYHWIDFPHSPPNVWKNHDRFNIVNYMTMVQGPLSYKAVTTDSLIRTLHMYGMHTYIGTM